MSQAVLSWPTLPAQSARGYLWSLFASGWFRCVYDRDGWPILRSRSARVDSGLLISSDPTVGGLVACPIETLSRTVKPVGMRRLQTWVGQARQFSFPIPPTGLTAWGPLLLTDLRSDDPLQPYETPTPSPVGGGPGFDAQLVSQQVYLWTANVPASVADLDPVFVELQQRADRHLMQQTLGDGHRLTVTLDSAVALAECGQELAVYWPERAVVGRYQVIRMSQPLGVGAQTWLCRFVSGSV